jgi:hypothetical protein
MSFHLLCFGQFQFLVFIVRIEESSILCWVLNKIQFMICLVLWVCEFGEIARHLVIDLTKHSPFSGILLSQIEIVTDPLRDIIRRVNSLFMVFHEEENLLWA